MAEEHEGEISVGEEEVWVKQASQFPPFLAGFPATLEDCAGVSSEYPSFPARFGVVRVDQKLRSRRWAR